MPTRMNLWTILPVKSLHQTKSRLSGVLSPDERADLTLWLLARTLHLLSAVPQLNQTAVITQDPIVAERVMAAGCRWLPEPPGSGLNGAVMAGVTVAGQGRASHCLILPSDLPLLTAAELAELVTQVETAVSQPTLLLCSDRHEQGTNALVIPTGVEFQFWYGRDSFHRHQQEAGRRGLACQIVELPGIQFDLDTEQDYMVFTNSVPLSIC